MFTVHKLTSFPNEILLVLNYYQTLVYKHHPLAARTSTDGIYSSTTGSIYVDRLQNAVLNGDSGLETLTSYTVRLLTQMN
jgi:hypothetical protein